MKVRVKCLCSSICAYTNPSSNITRLTVHATFAVLVICKLCKLELLVEVFHDAEYPY